MHMFPMFLLVVFLIARANSAYHPHLLFKGYFVIKNKTLSKILIDQSDPATARTKNAKANRDKLTYAGTVFYILFLLLICFSVVMLILPDIPCEPFVFDSKALFLTGDTLNEKLPIVFAFALLYAGMGFYFLNTSKYAAEKASAKKFTLGLSYFFVAMGIAGVISQLWVAITSILHAV